MNNPIISTDMQTISKFLYEGYREGFDKFSYEEFQEFVAAIMSELNRFMQTSD